MIRQPHHDAEHARHHRFHNGFPRQSPSTLSPEAIAMSFWFFPPQFSFLKNKFYWNITHIFQNCPFKVYTIQCFLTYSQSCATITTNFRTSHPPERPPHTHAQPPPCPQPPALQPLLRFWSQHRLVWPYTTHRRTVLCVCLISCSTFLKLSHAVTWSLIASFGLMRSIPLQGCSTACLPIYQLMGIWVVSSLG